MIGSRTVEAQRLRDGVLKELEELKMLGMRVTDRCFSNVREYGGFPWLLHMTTTEAADYFLDLQDF
jgi:hypothetical protein